MDTREALILDPEDKSVRKFQNACISTQEDFKLEANQWMIEKGYEELEDKTLSKLLQDPQSESDISDKEIDLRGTEIFQKVLMDRDCKISILKLDNVRLGAEGRSNCDISEPHFRYPASRTRIRREYLFGYSLLGWVLY